MQKRFFIKFLLGMQLLFLLTYSSCEKEVSVSEPEPLPVDRQIYINSIPSGALIYLNGKNTGHYTPDTLKWLETSQNMLLLKLTNYLDTTISFIAAENEKTTMFIDYLKDPRMYGSLLCYTTPSGAAIYLNDSLTSYTTPAEFTLAPGKYEVKYEYFGYLSDSASAIVQSSSKKTLHKTLKDTSVWYTINTFNSPLPSNNITALEKSGQKLFVGTNDGLAVYNNQKWEIYTTNNSILPANRITSIATNSTTGVVWIGTANGLVSLNNSVWTLYNTYNSCLRDNYIYEVKYERIENVIYAATKEGFVRFEYSSCALYNTSNTNLKSNAVYALDINYFGDIWIGWYGGLAQKKSGAGFSSFQFYTELPSGQDVSVIKIGNTTEGIWAGLVSNPVAGIPGGLIHFSNGVWEAAGISGTINDIEIGRGFVWAATPAGLYKIVSKNVYTLYNSGNSGIPQSPVSSIAIDDEGPIWIGTAGAGLIRFNYK